jgi:hypothetical protein
MKKVFLQYNQLSHLPESYQQRMWDIADFYQQLPFEHDYIVQRTSDLDQAFAELSDIDPDWVVVVSLGHCTQNRDLYDDCINSAIELGTPLLAHLLNFKDQYPHVHPQLFAVDYQTWKAVGWPSWNYDAREQAFTSLEYVASDECVHDDYTPYRIRSTSESKKYRVTEMQVGAKVIRALFENAFHVHNLLEPLRQGKFHLYPDRDWEEFDTFLNGGEYTGTNSSQKHYCELMTHLNNQVRRQYYVLNTEPLTRIPVNSSVAHYAGVASGLKLFCTMAKNGFNDFTKVTYFDFSPIALQFQKALINNWDGDFNTYEYHCEKFKQANRGYFPCSPSGSWGATYRYLLNDLQLYRPDFQELWRHFQGLEHRFVEIDLYQDQDQRRLVELLGCFESNYLWISNAFYMEYSLVRYGKDYLHTVRQGLLDKITERGKFTVLDTNDFWHQGLITFGQDTTEPRIC